MMDINTGDLLLFSGDLIPEGFAACDGSRLRIDFYPTLFRLLNTRFGGDGINDFGLPTLPPVGDAIYLIRIAGPTVCASPFLQPALAPRIELAPAVHPFYLPAHSRAA